MSERCEDCAEQCPTWYADHDRWNFVTAHMQNGRASVLCPSCFTTRWTLVTGLTASWRLVPENMRPVSHDGPAEPTAMCSSSPLDDEQPVVFFRGRIRDASGGEVTISLDRAAKRYPRVGAHVVVDELAT